MRRNQILTIIAGGIAVAVAGYSAGHAEGKSDGITEGRRSLAYDMNADAIWYYLDCLKDKCAAEKEAYDYFRGRAEKYLCDAGVKDGCPGLSLPWERKDQT